jgi:myo-inositol-1(or 4)-monophosphatase
MARPIPGPDPASPGGGDSGALLRTALEAARLGGEILRRHLEGAPDLAVTEKGRNDYVTRADREAEEAVVSLIRSRHPEHGFRAEESPASPGTGAEWIIDPLDGTTNFIHRYPFFATSVAVRAEGVLQAGAVYDPVRDEMFAAARGWGATLNGSPIRISGCPDLSGALLVTGFPFRSLAALPRFLDSLERLIRASSGVRRDGSAALDCCYVACGRYDGFWECALSAWDIAAGALIIREAGGVVTDFEGADGFLDSGDIVASSPGMHPAFLGEVRKAFRP